MFEAQQETVETQPRTSYTEEVGIIEKIESGGVIVPWILPTRSLEGAKQDRVSLTDAAALLGYQDKRDLRRLAERHSEEIAEFGEMGTVPVSSVMPNGGVKWVDEPTYNPDQFIILGLSSQTEMGKRIRVWLLKSFNKLMARFGQEAPQEDPPALPNVDLSTLVEALRTQAQTINNFVELNLLRERNEAERIKSQQTYSWGSADDDSRILSSSTTSSGDAVAGVPHRQRSVVASPEYFFDTAFRAETTGLLCAI